MLLHEALSKLISQTFSPRRLNKHLSVAQSKGLFNKEQIKHSHAHTHTHAYMHARKYAERSSCSIYSAGHLHQTLVELCSAARNEKKKKRDTESSRTADVMPGAGAHE